nr:MAG TPA: hypothetical protein [Caudoviricetes sp.]
MLKISQTRPWDFVPCQTVDKVAGSNFAQIKIGLFRVLNLNFSTP